ncbi:2-succinyl-5-enolpyruvyl-6-hydroxy-3-cyclohexene-1-carboxylic-acid synthase [Bacteroidota bacterium]
MPHRCQGIANAGKIFHEYGILNVIISPGMRNIPLIRTFVQIPDMNCISIVDERTAGYFAIGLSLHLNKPVVLCCTSGTALLNYTPALAEAYNQQVPIIVLSADRPPELIDQLENQTINQIEVFRNMVYKSYQLPVETVQDDDVWYANRMLSDAILSASYFRKPVHVNIPLREPLLEDLPDPEKDLRISRHIEISTFNPSPVPAEFIDCWKKCAKKMVLIGQMNQDESMNTAVNKLSEDPSVVVIAENISNVQGEQIITNSERIFLNLMNIENKRNDRFVPELIVSCGKHIVSKHAKSFLRKNKAIQHWHIQDRFELIDTFKSLTHIIQVTPSIFFHMLSEEGIINNRSSYKKAITEMDAQLNDIQLDYCRDIPYSDLFVFNTLFSKIPEHCNLHLGNSTPVRYSQLFPSKNTVRYFSNRGVSGIDGCLSTSVGYSFLNRELNLVILGDISFIYDSNALWINNFPPNLRIVVINNNGSDIFNITHAVKYLNKDASFVVTPHEINIRKIAEAFSVKFMNTTNKESLNKALDIFFKSSDKAVLLEIGTAKSNNSDILETLYLKFKNYKP